MLETSDGRKYLSVAEMTTAERQRNNEQRQRELRENRELAQRAAANFENAKAEAERVRVAAEQSAFEAALRESLRTAYVKSNGSEFGFDAAYPGLPPVTWNNRQLPVLRRPRRTPTQREPNRR